MSEDTDFNALHFEKKLSSLKDSQDSINATCQWCLEHKKFHKKIVAAWLNVLKRVRVEQRLVLFYLANDVIQYSKRKNFDFVESWGTALQKATTLVRDAKVKNKVLRIFKIWEERSVYGEEFISDLSGLISVSPSAKKIDETHEFQPTHLISKIRVCSKLETDTDYKLKIFKQHNPKLQDGEALMSSLKDRAHVDDVEKEMTEYVSHLESYIAALRMEIKARSSLVNLLLTAECQLEKDRKDVKVVAVAYKSFASRVKNLKKKLDEKIIALNSPVPSPDVNAPSPSPDSDLDLPDNNPPVPVQSQPIAFENAGFYNSTSDSTHSLLDTTGSFVNTEFSSFIGTGVTFSLNDGKLEPSAALSNLFSSIAQPPPPPAPVPAPLDIDPFHYNNASQPLAPPPLPPFTNVDGMYPDYSNSNYGVNGSYGDQTPQEPSTQPQMDNYYHPAFTNTDTNTNNINPQQQAQQQQQQQQLQQPSMFNFDSSLDTGTTSYDPYKCDEYNPEEECETWNESEWDQPPTGLETPASPPPLEKEGFIAPVEYHDDQNAPGAMDIDHRVLITLNNNPDKQDIDHRNLISLTGSPKFQGEEGATTAPGGTCGNIQMGRRNSNSTGKGNVINKSPRKQDNVESIDMELSDDETLLHQHKAKPKVGLLPPPPPFFVDDSNFPVEPMPVVGPNEYDHLLVDNNQRNWKQSGGMRRHNSHNDMFKMRRGRGFLNRRGFPPPLPPNVSSRGELNNRGDFADSWQAMRGRGGSNNNNKYGPRDHFEYDGRPWRGRGGNHRGRNFHKSF